MSGANFYAKAAKVLSLPIFVVILAAAVTPLLAQAHLLNGSRGPVDAFNYDEKLVQHLDSDCGNALECRQTDIKDVFFFNCYYDVKSGECQCSKGDFSRCNVSRSSLDSRQAAAVQGSGGNGITGLAGSVVAAPRLFYSRFMALPLLARVFILAVAAAAIAFGFNRLRDSSANNLRAARELHAEAAELHDRGKEEKARALLEKSNYHREKAYEQMQSKVQ